MLVEKLVVGYLRENCYIGTIGDKSFIVDPGDEYEKIIDACKGKNIVEILVTHNHFDHVGALEEVENHFGIKANTKSGLLDYEVIPTPRHTSDSKTFYFRNENVMFTGDFIFYETIGRTDLETSNPLDMIHSLELISKYDDNIKVYPGHGKETNLGHEKKRFKFYY